MAAKTTTTVQLTRLDYIFIPKYVSWCGRNLKKIVDNKFACMDVCYENSLII